MTTIFENSETFFLKFISKYDIILDDNYNNIKNIYYKYDNIINIYKPYITLFDKYNDLNDQINFIYYIIILFYTDINTLLNFIRFYTSKLNNFNLIDKSKIKRFSQILKYNKLQLIKYLKNIINYDKETLLFFIICIQLYF